MPNTHGYQIRAHMTAPVYLIQPGHGYMGSSLIGTLAYRDDSLIGTILKWMLFFGNTTVNVILEHTCAELFKYRKLFSFLMAF